MLAIANVPIVWLFGIRNNILIWLTGWSFSTFNSFHRWAARVATIEAIIHSIAYTVEAFLGMSHCFWTMFRSVLIAVMLIRKFFIDGGSAEYDEEWTQQYWWMGAIVCTSPPNTISGTVHNISIKPTGYYMHGRHVHACNISIPKMHVRYVSHSSYWTWRAFYCYLMVVSDMSHKLSYW